MIRSKMIKLNFIAFSFDSKVYFGSLSDIFLVIFTVKQKNIDLLCALKKNFILMLVMDFYAVYLIPFDNSIFVCFYKY